MEYQEKILAVCEKYDFYDKLLFYYKLGKHEFFDRIISDHFKLFLVHHHTCLENGRHYGKSYCSKDEYNERHGPYEIYWPNGVLKEKCSYTYGELNGFLNQYENNGQLSLELNFENGEENGVAKFWWPDGKLKLRISYIDGIRNGLYENFHTNGKPNVVCWYKGNRLEGVYKRYFTTGQQMYEYNYEEGLYNGIYRRWDKNGKLLTRHIYKNNYKI